jgi:hypothetical protein
MEAFVNDHLRWEPLKYLLLPFKKAVLVRSSSQGRESQLDLIIFPTA